MHRAVRSSLRPLVVSVALPASLAALGFACRAEPHAGEGGAAAAPATPLTREELRDPRACAPCHAAQVAEWEGSAHASAADDPLFRAMNRRGQRETAGALGAFCVGCHAPLAVAALATTDGQNLDDVPRTMKGITCQVCHAADSLEALHDPALPFALADDGVLRGAQAGTDARGSPRTQAHRSAYSARLDRDDLGSSSLCGRCHDVSGPGGAHAGRTFTEWRASVFADMRLGTSCGQCHMPVIRAGGDAAPRHDHAFVGAGAGLGLGPSPGDAPSSVEARRSAVQAALDTVVQSALCVRQIGDVSTVQVILENVGAGHAFPGAAIPDRRLWVELHAYAGGDLLLESGAPDGADRAPEGDPNLWLARDCLLDGNGQATHFVWGAREVRTSLLPALSTFDRTDVRYYQTHQAATYPRGASATLVRAPDRVTMGLRFAPVGLDVVDDLIAGGDLDPALRARATVYALGRDLEWTPDGATETFRDNGVPTSCISATGLLAAADKVQAPATCTRPIPPEPASPPPPAGSRVTCADDASLDAIGPGTERTGALGVFRVVLRAAAAARAANAWTLEVRTASGEPVPGADVRAQARMRDHGHAPPDAPLTTAGAEAGQYVVSPLHFFLPGVWRTTFTIDVGGKKDVATFDFCVEG
jgi:hypothetical protein